MDSYTYTYKSEVITNEFGGSLVGATATVSTISVYLPTSEIGGPKLTPIAVMPAVTLVRKEGDEEDAASLNRNGVGVMAVAWSLAAVLGAAFLA